MFFLGSCLSDSTGPGLFRRGTVTFRAVFENAQAPRVVDFTRVRIRLLRPGTSTVALDTTVNFPAAADSLVVPLTVALQGTVAEQFDLTLAMINAAGDTVFRGGPTRVTAELGPLASPAPNVPIVYVGVGANAAGVRFVTVPTWAFFQDTFTVTAEAFNAQGTAIPGTPIVFTSLDGPRLAVPVEDVGRVVAGTVRGTARLQASLLTNAPSAIATLIVQPKPAALSIVSGNNQSGGVGVALTQPLVVLVKAADSLSVGGATVNFAVTAGGGTLSAASAVTDSLGRASVTWTLGATPGAQAVSATVAGVPAATAGFAANAASLAPKIFVFTTQPPASVTAGVPFTVVVSARDTFGNTVTGYTGNVTLALSANPGGATLLGTTTVAASAGVATFTTVRLTKAAAGYALQATATGPVQGFSGSFAIVPAPAAALTFSTQPPASTAYGAAFGVAVAAVDSVGNTVPSFTGSVTLSIGTNPAGGTLSGTVSQAAVAGVASFSGLALDNIGAGYRLAAAAASLTGGTSSLFNVTAPVGVNAWTNIAGGTWNTAGNWSKGVVPGATDTVEIKLCGTYQVDLNVNIAVERLSVGCPTSGTQTLRIAGFTMTVNNRADFGVRGALLLDAGTIAGAGLVDVSGAMTWSGGNLSGGGGSTRVLVGGTLSVTGSGSGRSLNNYTLELAGTGTWGTTVAAMSSGSGGTLRVLAGGQLDVTGDFGVLYNQGGAASRVVVYGQLRRVTSANPVQFTTTADDSGTVAVLNGTLQLDGGGTSNGSYSVSAGNTLSFGGGTHSLAAASTVSGAGTVQIPGGTLTSAGGWSVTGTTRINGGTANFSGASMSTVALDVSSGTLGGGAGGLLTASGAMTWTGGGLTGSGGTTRVLNTGSLAISGTTTRQINGYTLEQGSATGTWAGIHTVNSGSGGILRVLAGGALDIQGDPTFSYNQGGATSLIENLGTINRTTSTAAATFGAPFNSSGTLNVLTGNLVLNSGGAHSGSVAVSSGAFLDLAAGTFTLNNPFSATGAGAVRLQGATLVNATAADTARFLRLDLNTGILNEVGGVVVAGTGAVLNWTSTAAIQGAGTLRIDPTATMNVTGTGSRTFTSGTILNQGTTVLSGAVSINTGLGAVWRNAAGATFTLSGDGNLTQNQGGTVTLFDNLGSFTRTTSVGTAPWSAAFNHSGAATMTISTGILQLNGGGVMSAPVTVTSPAFLDLGAGTFTLNNGLNVTGTGTARLQGATIVNATAADTARFLRLDVNTGTLNHSGGVVVAGTGAALNWTSTAAIQGAGTLRIDPTATMNVTGTGSRTFINGTILNQGTTVWSDAVSINTGVGAVWRNAAGATFTLSGDGNLTQNQGGTVTIFDNLGSFTRNTSVGTAPWSAAFNHSGAATLTISTGILQLNGGGVMSAPVTVTSPGFLDLGAGTFTLNNGLNVTGTGTARLQGATIVNATAADTARFLRLDLNTGILNEVGGVVVAGTGAVFNWTSTAAIQGAGTLRVDPTATMNVTGTGSRTFVNGTILNQGATVWSGTLTINTGLGAAWRNVTGANFTLSGDGAFALNQGGAATFQNWGGAFTRNTSTGTATWSASFSDSLGGAFNINTGTLQLMGGGRLSGTRNINGTATLEFGAGTMSLRAGSGLAGTGRVLVSGATLTADSLPGSVTLANIDFTAGTIAHEGLVTVNGAFNWSGGNITSNTVGLGGTTSMSSPGVLTISGAATRTLSGIHVLQVGGGATVTWTGTSTMNVGLGMTVRVQAGGLFDIQGDGTMSLNQGGTATFDVQATGTLRRSVSPGVATLQPAMNKLGVIDVQSGTLLLTGGSVTNFAGTFTGAGTVDLGAGTFTTTGNFTIPGNLTVSGGAFTFAGATRTIAVTGNFSTTGVGVLNMTTATDSLDIGGNASFGGGNGTLNAGVIRLAGNFAQTGTTSFRGLAQSAAVAHRVRLEGAANTTVSFADPANSFFRRLLVAKGAGTSATITSDVKTTYFALLGGTYSFKGTAGPPMTQLIADTVAGNPSGSVSMVSPLVLVVNAANLQDSNIINVDTVVFAGSGQTIRTTVPTGGAGSYTFHSIRVAQSAGTATMGQLLNLTNDLVVSSGTLNLGGFHIGVTGSFRTESSGVLQMITATDSLGIAGNAAFGGGSTAGLLTNGIITVNGNFVQTSGTSAAAFAPSGAHRVSLRGTGAQNLNFANTTSSFFDVLEAAATGTRNIVLQSNIRTNDSLIVLGGGTATDVISAGTTQRLTVNGFLRVTQQTLSPLVRPAVLELAAFPSVDSIFAAGRGVSPDTAVFLSGNNTFPDGTPMRYKSVRIANNAVMNYSTGGFADSLLGDLVVDGTSTFALTGGTLVVAGKLRTINTGVLRMQTAFTQLTVADSAIFGGGSTNGQLTNGALRLRGHFVQAGNAAAFSATLAHQTEFIGQPTGLGTVQNVTFANPGTGATLSHFNQMRLVRAIAGNVKVNLLTNAQAALVVDTSAGQNDSILGTGTVTLTTDSIQLQNTVFNRVPLVVSSPSAALTVQSVRFEAMDPTTTYLTMFRNVGAQVTMNSVNFATAHTTGRYFAANTVGAGGPGTFTFLTSLPASFTSAAGDYTRTGATLPTVNWNGVPNP